MSKETANPFKMKTANIVAFMIIVFSFGFTTLLVYKEIPQSNAGILNVIIGILIGTGFSGVIYWLYNYKKNDENTNSSKIPSLNCPVCGKPFNQVNQNLPLVQKRGNKASPVVTDTDSNNFQPQVYQQTSDIEDEEGRNPDKRLDIQ